MLSTDDNEVDAFLGPTVETATAVNAWLAENGISAKKVSSVGDWIEFTLPVNQANTLFDADFTLFKHTVDGTEAIRTLQYSLPVDLQSSISLLYPGVSCVGHFMRRAQQMTFYSVFGLCRSRPRSDASSERYRSKRDRVFLSPAHRRSLRPVFRRSTESRLRRPRSRRINWPFPASPHICSPPA